MKAQGSAVVTGASRGIGRAVSLELARRGFSVVATMRNPDDGADLAERLGDATGSIVVQQLDIRKVEDFSYPDDLQVLVNNAGTKCGNTPVEETSLADWRDVFETNVFGTMEMVKRAVPVMRAGGGGVICNVTSSSILSILPFFSTYRASKAAISVMNETLRVELAPFGIRVVEILPGPIDTNMFRTSVVFKLPEAAQFEPYRQVCEQHFPASKFVPIGLITPPARAAEAICDALFDDDGPMRYGCDDMSIRSLETWRSNDDEAPMRQAVAYFMPAAAGRTATDDTA
jgi:NAD(P)-dependent dehydrogenase (short-subunit alcohol dehydrogenase family)